MLTEISRVRQESGTGRRRWFQGDGIELIVWQDAGGSPEGFQICYQQRGIAEHALTWRRQQGFSHARVDSGDTRPDKNLTPILVPDGPVPWEHLRREFAEVSETMETWLKEFVAKRLAEGES